MDETQQPSRPNPLKGGTLFLTLSAFALLLPFFFLPSATYPLEFTKVFLALVAVAVILVIFSVRTLRTGVLAIRTSLLSFALLFLPVTYLISAIFSSAPSLSFFGYQLDQDTFGFMALCSILALSVTLAADSEKKVWSVLKSLYVGGALLLLFQVVQILFHVPLHLGLFSTPIQNLLGKWNDLALFASFMGSLSLLALEAFSLSATKKAVVGVTALLAFIILAIANLPLAWILVGVSAFMFLVFSFMRRHMKNTSEAVVQRPSSVSGVASLVALALVIFFLFFGSGVSGRLQSNFRIAALEVSPSMKGTLNVLENVYGKRALVGSGPNTFAHDWLLYRPTETLSSIFWGTEFDSGYSYVATAITTGGIIVFFGWLFLIGIFIWSAFRGLLYDRTGGGKSYILSVATGYGCAFLLATHLFYNPSQSLTLMLFLFLGLFIASLPLGVQKTRIISFSESPRLGFVAIVLIAIVMVVSLISVYSAGVVYAASVAESKALVRSNANDLTGALAFGKEAVALSPKDRYLRALTSLELANLNSLVQSGKSDATTQASFQTGLSQAVSTALSETAADPLSYDNWMSRASVYEAVVPLNIAGAADNAISALESARKLNPATPEVDYQEATIKAYQKDAQGAKTAALAAIAKKADYTPAILLLAQISLSEGNLNDAIAALKSAIYFTPNDSSLLYELGLLELQSKDYTTAAAAFTQAITVTPNYANAQFFLGEADVFLGNKNEALTLFTGLQKTNPDNTTLADIIAQINKGANPFAKGTPLPPETVPAPLR